MKTIEEVAREFSYWESFPETHEEFIETIENNFKKGVAFAQQWISVDDELPEIDIPVFIRYKWDTKDVVDYEAVRRVPDKESLKGWHWSSIPCRTYFAKKVTHWRPIEYK